MQVFVIAKVKSIRKIKIKKKNKRKQKYITRNSNCKYKAHSYAKRNQQGSLIIDKMFICNAI